MADRIGSGVWRRRTQHSSAVIDLGPHFPHHRPRLHRGAVAAADPPIAQDKAEESTSMPEVNGGDDAVARNGGNEDFEEEATIENDDSPDAFRGSDNGVAAAEAAASAKQDVKLESASSNDQHVAAAAKDQSVEQQQARSTSLSINHETTRKRAASADGIECTEKRKKRFSWEERLDQLKTYKEEHGDCRVPYMYHPNPPLGMWVANQRMAYRSKSVAAGIPFISDDQIAQLEEIGFVWSTSSKDQNVEAAANDQSVEEQQARPASLSNNHETTRKGATSADGIECTEKQKKRF